MSTEIEIKFLNLVLSNLITQLELNNAQLMKQCVQRISIFETINSNDRDYLRVRDEGDKITLTHKVNFKGSEIAKETEVIVNSYEDTISILKSTGLTLGRVEEKKRISYRLLNCYLDIDTWPDIPTYLEIESDDKANIIEVCKLLNLSYDESFKGSAHDVFRSYGIEPKEHTTMTFTENSLNSIES